MERKNVFLTGASKGIGHAIRERLLLEGYNVISPNRSELNLLDKDSILSFIHQYGDRPLYALINNAAINPPSETERLDDQTLEDTIMINLQAPIMLARGFLPNLKRHPLSYIVNISSIWGLHSKAGRLPYSATKFGLNGVTKSLAVELGKENILVNSVCPGYINTEMTKRNVPEEYKKMLFETGRIPLRRFAEPEEVAKLVNFLVSENNTYITGQTIVIDGGYTST